MSSLQTFIRPNCQSDTVQTVGRSQDFSLMGPQVERQRRDNQGAERCEEVEWVSPSPLGVRSGEGCAPPQNFFFNFYIKIVGLSFRAFWVAISYRLADCFTRIGNTPGIEIYWRSFQHFGN